jgi:hypothetical protein
MAVRFDQERRFSRNPAYRFLDKFLQLKVIGIKLIGKSPKVGIASALRKSDMSAGAKIGNYIFDFMVVYDSVRSTTRGNCESERTSPCRNHGTDAYSDEP